MSESAGDGFVDFLKGNPPHIWTMDESVAHREIWSIHDGGRAILPPWCRFCGIDSFTAQQQHPETKGVGPCPKRK